MTYFGFLLRFLFVPIIIFLIITLWDNRNNKQIHGFRNGKAVWMAIGVHVLLAVVYTTPWDNYLVATGVWYYNPKLVTGIVFGYVPIEEYTFFVVETILSGLWWWFLSRRLSSPSAEFRPNKQFVQISSGLLIFIWILFTYLFFFGDPKWTYLSFLGIACDSSPTDIWCRYSVALSYAGVLGDHDSGGIFIIDGRCRVEGNNVVNLPHADNGYFILWDLATGRSCILLHYKRTDHLRHDAPAGKGQREEGCRDQGTASELERGGISSTETLTRSWIHLRDLKRQKLTTALASSSKPTMR